ncbi:hypothetical protein HanIR_Chr05g0233261 [Helianthus annuus]|nr:hypothetical protein HanIR_Chr05g0233261 [Helianthus annuus]
MHKIVWTKNFVKKSKKKYQHVRTTYQRYQLQYIFLGPNGDYHLTYNCLSFSYSHTNTSP